MRNATPACGIDWQRPHTLPIGVPPEAITDADRVQYARGLAAGADIPLSTYGRYFTVRPEFTAVRKTASGHILPGDSAAAPIGSTLPAAASAVVDGRPFSPQPPDPGTPADVEAQLQRKVPFDRTSRSFAPLPIPFRDLDSIRFFFASQSAPPFAGTFGLDERGVLPVGTTLPATLPGTLLATRMDGGTRHIGELNRLLLRAPVSGRFRFEPYYVYSQPTATTFEAVGPSNSGRLLVEQPALSTQQRIEKTDTQVFKARVFAFEHVDRTAVAPLIHHVLVLQLAFVKEMVTAHNAGATVRAAIPNSSPEVLGWVLDAVNGMLRAWTAYLSVLRWRAQDAAVAGAIPAAWLSAFPPRPLKPSDAKRVTDAVDALVAHANWVESLLFFSESVLAPKLAGFTWTEILARNGQDPATKRFPVTKDQPPFAPRDNALATQHQRLRLIEDPNWRWVPCFAGCPIGLAGCIYAPTAPLPGSVGFPAGGLSTYELEVLHAAGEAHTALGLPHPVAGAPPHPGEAMDVSPYTANTVGHACLFTAQRSGSDSLYTTVDWLVELTRGIHFSEDEAGFLDLFKLMDPDTGGGHPVLAALRADDHNRAIHLRRQMDALEATTLAADSAAWWAPRVGFPSVTPTTPYRAGRTRVRTFTGLLRFDDLNPVDPALARPSGFDTFDLESAMLATGRMSDPIDGPNRLPLPVLLAIMEREGIKLFAAINRHVRNTTTAASTLRWEAYYEDTARAAWAAGLDGMGRQGWFLFPYGLDVFGRPKTDAGVTATVTAMKDSGVLAVADGEDVARYVRERVFSQWDAAAPPAGPGRPHIWKRSRRVRWAGLSLMAGFFRHIEAQIRAAVLADNPFSQPPWHPDPAWFPAASSPPDLTGKSPTDIAWKDYISYFALIYAGYNTAPENWRALVRSAQADHANEASPLGLRDFFLFRHSRGNQVIDHVVRFAVGLDAFLRLDSMLGKAPKDYPTATPDTTAPAGRAWGV